MQQPGRSPQHNARHAEAHASILNDVKGLAKLLHISKEVADTLEVKTYRDYFIQTMVEKEAIASVLSAIHEALKEEKKEFRSVSKTAKHSKELEEELELSRADVEALKDRIRVVEEQNAELAAENELLKQKDSSDAV